MKTKQNVDEYINHRFRIPAYQRGYKWGIEKNDGSTDASILVYDIINALRSNKEEYFIQGITIYCKKGEVYIIDGQQRTTTLFLLLALIKKNISEIPLDVFFYENEPRIHYEIREDSHHYLENLFKGNDNSSTDTQDIFYFKHAIASMEKTLLTAIEKEPPQITWNSFYEYLMNHVVMFVIIVPEKEAADVFSMMNGQKVYMQADELVKADILCKSSSRRNILKKKFVSTIDDTLLQLKELMKEETANEWEQNAVRSRFAREWDKWLYWWNQPVIRYFFHIKTYTMGWLIRMFCKLKDNDFKYSNNPNDIASAFKAFQNEFLTDSCNAKLNFERLRKLQKKFEYVYINIHTYNYVGMLLSCCHEHIEDDLKYIINHFKAEEDIKRYVLLRIAGITSKEIISNDYAITDKIKELYKRIEIQNLYEVDPECVYRMMFMLNVLASDNRSVKFEFFYKEKDHIINFYEKYRSAEHIWPKSKVKHIEIVEVNGEQANIYKDGNGNELKDNIDYLDRADFPEKLTEHCIGNMALLHKTDNSVFNDLEPEDKKKIYFDLNNRKIIYSRNLIYSISQFAFNSWTKENAISRIIEYQKNTIDVIKKQYETYIIK